MLWVFDNLNVEFKQIPIPNWSNFLSKNCWCHWLWRRVSREHRAPHCLCRGDVTTKRGAFDIRPSAGQRSGTILLFVRPQDTTMNGFVLVGAFVLLCQVQTGMYDCFFIFYISIYIKNINLYWNFTYFTIF